MNGCIPICIWAVLIGSNYLNTNKGEGWELVIGGSVGGRIERMNIIKYQRMNKIYIML